MESRVATVLAALLAVILVVFGILGIQDRDDEPTHTLVFGWLSVLGAACIVTALAVRRSSPNVGTALLVVGSVVAVIPTMQTLVLPVLELGVIALALREHTRAARAF